MPASSLAVLGLFSGLEKAEEALDYLTSERFISDDISVLMREGPKAKLAAGTLGLLAGLDTISIPGSGSFITAGPIHAGLSQTDGLEAYLSGLGISPSAAQRISASLSEGAVLLSVQFGNVDDRNRASHVLRGAGADEIVSTQEKPSQLLGHR